MKTWESMESIIVWACTSTESSIDSPSLIAFKTVPQTKPLRSVTCLLSADIGRAGCHRRDLQRHHPLSLKEKQRHTASRERNRRSEACGTVNAHTSHLGMSCIKESIEAPEPTTEEHGMQVATAIVTFLTLHIATTPTAVWRDAAAGHR